jgi:uncharacterized integral membrane protein
VAKKILITIGLLLLLIASLFIFQNSQRTTMPDVNGGYLSLDLFVWGIQLGEPIGVSFLLLISFVLGMLFTLILQGLRSMLSGGSQSDWGGHDDYGGVA